MSDNAGTGTSVGAITLDLRILNTISEQINSIAAEAQQSAGRKFEAVGDSASKAMQKPLENAGAAMEKAITAPVENAQKTVQATLKKTQDQVDSAVSKMKDTVTGAQDNAVSKLAAAIPEPEVTNTNPGPEWKPQVDPAEYMANYNNGLDHSAAPDLSDTFLPAANAADLLQQKMTNLQMQFESEREKLAGLNAEFSKLSVGTKAWDEMSAKITAAEGHLISLQSTLNATQAKIDEPAKKAAAAAEKAAAAQEKAAQKAAAAQEKAAQQAAAAAEKAAAREEAAQARAAASVSASAKRGGTSMGTLRTQVNSMLSAVTTSSKGIAQVGVMGRAFSSSLTGSLAVAGPLAAAAAAFGILRKSISLASVNSDQFKSSLNAVKANLEVAFTPIYQAILPALNSLMSWLAAATKQIAAFIAAIFGKSYAQEVAATKKMQQNAAAASKSGSGSGSKSQGQLASFDQLNVIGQKDNSSTGGIDYDALNTKGTEAATNLADKFKKAWAGIASAFQDWVVKPITDNLALFDGPVAKFKALFADIGTQCRAWMQPLSDWFQNDFKNALSVTIRDAMTILAGLADSFANVAQTVWKFVEPVIDWFVRNGLPMFTQMWVQLCDTAVTAFDLLKTIFDTLWNGVIDPFAQLVSKMIVDLLNTFKSLWDQYGASTFDKIRAAIDNAKAIFLNLWNVILKPIFDQLFSTLNQLWTEHLLPLINQIGQVSAKFTQAALDIYNQFIAPIVNWFIKTFGPIIASVIGSAIKTVGTLVGNIFDAATNILKALGGVIDFLTGVFTGNWEKAWTGVKEIFSGVFNALYDIARVPLNAVIGLINGVISGINALIRGLNRIHFDIPATSFTKAMSFGIHIDPIQDVPYLANGAVLTQPTLAMMGEYPGAQNNPEIAAPQSTLKETFMETMVPLLNEMEEFRADIVKLLLQIIEKNPNITLDGATLARLLKPYSQEEDKRVGKQLFSI